MARSSDRAVAAEAGFFRVQRKGDVLLQLPSSGDGLPLHSIATCCMQLQQTSCTCNIGMHVQQLAGWHAHGHATPYASSQPYNEYSLPRRQYFKMGSTYSLRNGAHSRESSVWILEDPLTGGVSITGYKYHRYSLISGDHPGFSRVNRVHRRTTVTTQTT